MLNHFESISRLSWFFVALWSAVLFQLVGNHLPHAEAASSTAYCAKTRIFTRYKCSRPSEYMRRATVACIIDACRKHTIRPLEGLPLPRCMLLVNMRSAHGRTWRFLGDQGKGPWIAHRSGVSYPCGFNLLPNVPGGGFARRDL
jgi:hypothetical protein